MIFHAPRFDKGKLLKPATITVLHNGVLVQDHFELLGDTAYVRPPLYEAHPPKLPIQLQYHLNPVRFRNIWIRELAEFRVPPKPSKAETPQAKPEKKPAAAADKPQKKASPAKCKP